MVNIIHRIAVKAPLARVYAALSTVEGVAELVDQGNERRIQTRRSGPRSLPHSNGSELGRMEFDVIELNPNKKVHWRFKSGPEEWIGTDVTFELSQDGDSTSILFCSQELARGGRVHGPLQHEVGDVSLEPQGARRNRQGQAGPR